jgi:hypothetical protein
MAAGSGKSERLKMKKPLNCRDFVASEKKLHRELAAEVLGQIAAADLTANYPKGKAGKLRPPLGDFLTRRRFSPRSRRSKMAATRWPRIGTGFAAT